MRLRRRVARGHGASLTCPLPRKSSPRCVIFGMGESGSPKRSCVEAQYNPLFDDSLQHFFAGSSVRATLFRLGMVRLPQTVCERGFYLMRRGRETR